MNKKLLRLASLAAILAPALASAAEAGAKVEITSFEYVNNAGRDGLFCVLVASYAGNADAALETGQAVSGIAYATHSGRR